jgi:endonuclease YncB( thermonuclease family)
VRQAAVLVVAAALIAGGVALIIAGGSTLRSKSELSSEATAATDSGNLRTRNEAPPKRISTERPAFKGGVERQAARAVAPRDQKLTTPPIEDTGFERIQPRAALGDVGPALPPKPKLPAEWKGTILFQPVATAAGTLEAKGYRIAVAGIEPVGADESCDFQGRSWRCGVRARAAFRAWLRGRSVTCEVPPQADRETIVVPCRVGKQDVARWLVENGWARAQESGPYAKSGKKAEAEGKGIYGSPPKRIEMTLSPGGTSLPKVEAPPSEPAVQ